MAFIERPPVEIVPDGGAKVEKDRVEWVRVGWTEDADNPFTVVLELVAYDTSPVVSLLHGMSFVVLDAGSPRVHEGTVGGGHHSRE